jgi:dihydrofolate reductase
VRKIVVSEFLTLDGVMQAPGSPDEDREGGFDQGGWQMQFFDEDQMKVVSEGIAETDAYLFGRKTYEIFAGFWPTQPDDDPFAATLNGKPKYVVSGTLSEPLEWRNSSLVRGDAAAEIAKLKAQPGKNISVLGSGELVQMLAEKGLVDEYWLMICPIVLGDGKRLFRDGFAPTSFEVVDSATNSKGAVMATFRPKPAL